MIRKKRRENYRHLKCQFCSPRGEAGQSGSLPDYKKVEALQACVSDRGKIMPRERTGVCAKHQRRLSREIKRARYLALLPFVTKVQ